MKSLTEYLWFETKQRMEFVNITGKVEDLVSRSGVKEGLVLVNAMHISARSLSGLWADRLLLKRRRLRRRHQERDDPTPRRAPKLDFGPWEQIFYGEFDGRRRKRVLVKVIGE